MNDTRHIFFDGVKSIDLPQWRDSAWNFYTEQPEADSGELYSKVAAVFRAANMTANATANIPFALVNSKSGEDYDISDDWQNKVGFMEDPVELLRLWRLSLTMTNSAYGFMEGKVYNGRMAKGTNLRYIVPTTITPQVDQAGGLTGFKRALGTTVTDYLPVDMGGNILYMWRQDHTTELLPSKNTEFLAMMNAAGILYYADSFIKSFFSRGGIKPTMLMVKGIVNQDQRDKIESVWDKVVHGAYKYLGKIFNAEMITPTVIGDGIDNLKEESITQNKLADIAMAIGMPLSILLANSANYATAQTEYQSWFRDTLAPWCNFMAGCLNKQIFNAMGLRFEFRPEMTDPGQEDEVQRANAYQAYVNSGMLPSIAAQVVGIELPNGIEYTMLDPEPEPEPKTQPIQETEQVEDELEGETELTKELRRWRKKATKAFRAGKPALVEFVSDIIPDDARQYIERSLARATGEYEIRAAFLLDNTSAPIQAQPAPIVVSPAKSEIMALAEAINGAAKFELLNESLVDAIKGRNSGGDTVDIELIKSMKQDNRAVIDAIVMLANRIATQPAPTVQVTVPEQPPAQVTVTMPEMPAPVINVQPPQVTVEPQITVQMPSRKRKAKLLRDQDGRITGMETE